MGGHVITGILRNSNKYDDCELCYEHQSDWRCLVEMLPFLDIHDAYSVPTLIPESEVIHDLEAAINIAIAWLRQIEASSASKRDLGISEALTQIRDKLIRAHLFVRRLD